jgi:hypothetical protein
MPARGARALVPPLRLAMALAINAMTQRVRALPASAQYPVAMWAGLDLASAPSQLDGVVPASAHGPCITGAWYAAANVQYDASAPSWVAPGGGGRSDPNDKRAAEDGAHVHLIANFSAAVALHGVQLTLAPDCVACTTNWAASGFALHWTYAKNGGAQVRFSAPSLTPAAGTSTDFHISDGPVALERGDSIIFAATLVPLRRHRSSDDNRGQPTSTGTGALMRSCMPGGLAAHLSLLGDATTSSACAVPTPTSVPLVRWFGPPTAAYSPSGPAVPASVAGR